MKFLVSRYIHMTLHTQCTFLWHTKRRPSFFSGVWNKLIIFLMQAVTVLFTKSGLSQERADFAMDGE